MNLGWKLWDLPDGPNAGQYVCSVNPLRRIRPSPSRRGQEEISALSK